MTVSLSICKAPALEGAHSDVLPWQGVHSVAYAPLGILKGTPSLEEPTIQEIAKETGRPASQARPLCLVP